MNLFHVTLLYCNLLFRLITSELVRAHGAILYAKVLFYLTCTITVLYDPRRLILARHDFFFDHSVVSSQSLDLFSLYHNIYHRFFLFSN